MYLNHIPSKKSAITPFVILPGDPARVDAIGRYLTDFKIVGQRREYRIGIGFYKGIPVTVVSTGIGCPSTAIAAEELIDAGAKYLIRVGTCGGSWRDDIPAGSLVIPTACVRDEGTTREYIPAGFPAVADIRLINALRDSASEKKIKAFSGINRTHDAFYGASNSMTRWGRYLTADRFKGAETPILSSDMETAALFVIASLRNVSAGAALAVNANPEPLKKRISGKKSKVVTESSANLTKESVDSAIRTALDALIIINSNSNLS